MRELRGKVAPDSLKLRLGGRFDSLLESRCGVIPDRLHRLEAAGFDRLHHSIRCLGIVCNDVAAGQPRYFATGWDHGARLHDVVRASASIPYLFASVAADPMPTASKLLENFGVVLTLVKETHLSVARSIALAAPHHRSRGHGPAIDLKNYDNVLRFVRRTDPDLAHVVALQTCRSNEPDTVGKTVLERTTAKVGVPRNPAANQPRSRGPTWVHSRLMASAG